MYVTALRVNGCSPYSENTITAIKTLQRLSSYPEPATPADQIFFDRLMASALRETAKGLRKLGLGQGISGDASGLAACAASVEHLADRTSAPFACGNAAEAIAELSGTSAPLAVLDAAAYALGDAA
jgi:hypothetical protein